MSFPCNVDLVVGKRVLQRFVLGAKPMATDLDDKFDAFGDKMKVLENTRIITLSLLGTEIWRSFWKSPCDAMPCRKAINTEEAQASCWQKKKTRNANNK
ncbi:hypothetical protein AVEN_58307-1 [Araneus ventricosus]|uniref:Uncharacterized protein n=1 Tax=Araneus ventricosus TaxID=182803 RepID=A0A4Y2CPY2_ARAVE|nr:hypothetical protein AVEN_58307-1 [Araneus ventricosus]